MEALIEKLPFIFLGVVLLTLLVWWEIKFPEREYEENLKKRSYLTNTLIFVTNNALFLGFNITAIYALAYTYRLHDTWEFLPVWLQVVGGIIILDFVLWLWHWCAHNSDVLWRFHQAHHSEQYLNATSAIRFHVGELFLSLLFKAAFLLLLGVPFWIFLLNEALVTFFAAFHHSNITLSGKVQKIIELVIITPDLHRTHHSEERYQHDTNYGVIFSFWDRILKTRLIATPEGIGLKGMSEKLYKDFWLLPVLNKRK